MHGSTIRFLSDYKDLSGWIQAVGSLAAVSATYYVFRKQVELKNIEDKDRHNSDILSAETFILGNIECRKYILHINSIVKFYFDVNNRFSKNKYLIIKDAHNFDFAVNLVRKFEQIDYRSFNDDELNNLMPAYKIDVLNIQKSLLIINERMNYIFNIIYEIQSAENKENGDVKGLFKDPLGNYKFDKKVDYIKEQINDIKIYFDTINNSISSMLHLANLNISK